MTELYDGIADWWPVISPPSEYAEEATLYVEMIRAAARRPVREVLELGSGGGNNASHMKHAFAMTLVEPSGGMRKVSRKLNPECEHVAGDMRTVRLGRTFDAVFVHDAVMYMTTERDLRAALATVAAHLAPGGAALVAPDATAETFSEATEHGGGEDAGGRRAPPPVDIAADARRDLLRQALRFLTARSRRDRARRPRRTPRGAVRARDVAAAVPGGRIHRVPRVADDRGRRVRFVRRAARRAVGSPRRPGRATAGRPLERRGLLEPTPASRQPGVIRFVFLFDDRRKLTTL